MVETSHTHLNLNIEELLFSPYYSFPHGKLLLQVIVSPSKES
jgi:hypothetical protein